MTETFPTNIKTKSFTQQEEELFTAVSHTIDEMGLGSFQFDAIADGDKNTWLRLDLNHLPWGKPVMKLAQMGVLQELNLRMQRKIAVRWSAQKGFWFIVVPQEETHAEDQNTTR